MSLETEKHHKGYKITGDCSSTLVQVQRKALSSSTRHWTIRVTIR